MSKRMVGRTICPHPLGAFTFTVDVAVGSGCYASALGFAGFQADFGEGVGQGAGAGSEGHEAESEDGDETYFGVRLWCGV